MRCLIRLAQEGPDGRQTIPEISLAEGISEAYAGKLLRMLRLGGFVKAARGVGGYTLARPARQIIVRDVMAALGGRLFEVNFCETHCGQMEACVRSEDCSLRVLWHAVQTAVDDVLRKTTLEDLFRNERQMFTWIKGFGEPAPRRVPGGEAFAQLPGDEPIPAPLMTTNQYRFTPFCCVH